MNNRACLMSFGAALAFGTALAAPAPAQDAPKLLQGKAAFTDWHADRPGLRRHIRAADLPAADQSASSANFVRVAPRSGYEKPVVPPGFQVSLFAAGLDHPRQMRVAPNGDVFVVESGAGRIQVLRASENGEPRREVFAAGLNQPFGVSFYPPGGDPQWVYVANTNSVVRFAYQSGDLKARGPAETVVARLPSGANHWTRDVVFSPDGTRMFVSVGSASNVAEGIGKRDGAELTKWNAEHALGAAWGNETDRADVLSSRRRARTAASSRRESAIASVSPSVPTAICGARPTSATAWATTSPATTSPASRKARSTVGPGTISAPMKIPDTAARGPI
jgi:glucose/arabinose dehydrogenase